MSHDQCKQHFVLWIRAGGGGFSAVDCNEEDDDGRVNHTGCMTEHSGTT